MGKEFKLEDLCKTCANYNYNNNTCASKSSKQITTVYDGVTLYRDCDKYIRNCKIESLKSTE